MAVVNQTIMDTRFKTIIKSTITGTNATEVLVDVSTLVGYVDNLSIVNLAAINWSINGSIQLHWDTAKTLMYLDGNGKMGGANGFTALPNNQIASAGRGDIRITHSAARVGFIVLVCHKVESVVGQGGGWSN